MDDIRQLSDPLLIPPSGKKSNSLRGLVFVSPCGVDPALAGKGVNRVLLDLPKKEGEINP